MWPSDIHFGFMNPDDNRTANPRSAQTCIFIAVNERRRCSDAAYVLHHFDGMSESFCNFLGALNGCHRPIDKVIRLITSVGQRTELPETDG